MDFAWSPEHIAFRARLRGFLADHLPADWAERSRYDTSSQYVSEFSRWFCPRLAEAGLLIPHWPVELGGGGLDPFHHWILGEEMFAVGEPRSYQYMNVNWAGPAIIRFGTEAQRQEHIGRIAAGSVIWCQGFSEPSAGSDLAALKTRARRVGDGYVLNGAKIWTSGASLADYCFLLARTGGEGRGGISAFLVPMHSPGIEVRVIPNYMGERSVHEVFLTDVTLPESARLGAEDSGWSIVTHIMHNERIGAPRYTLTLRALDRAVELLQQQGTFHQDDVQQRAGRARAACEAARALCLQIISDRARGHPPSAMTNVARYALVSCDRLVAEFIGDYLHATLMANDDPLIAAAYRRTGSTGIAAGAAEIQLNLISRNLLALPRESRR
jgi:alkylation response protein AidB-like acyl-CoA dehydrogenase